MSVTPSGAFLARLAALKSLRPNSWYLIAVRALFDKDPATAHRVKQIFRWL